jgi:hypothetical protein
VEGGACGMTGARHKRVVGGAKRRLTDSRSRRLLEDDMAKIRALSIVVTLGLALLTTAAPAGAYVIEALTSIPANQAGDKAALEKMIEAAVDDLANHAVRFTPTLVSLREAKLVGDRIYLFVLLADADGEAEIEVMKAADTVQPGPDSR